MKKFKEKIINAKLINKLYFHDSMIDNVSFNSDRKCELDISRKQKYVKYTSPLFDVENYLSITFCLNNFGEGINESYSYLRLIDSNVSIEWIDDGSLQGQIHIPIRKN